ncbi:transporter [Actinosynnema sp. NPDC023658]|uniref:transporter n=1 Tax=Actinosynnema sp. NPDC023658 TaxID=3155465 RepID=UPI0034010DA7
MTWLAWRQLRFPVLSVHAALVVVGVLLAIARPGSGHADFHDQDTLYTAALIAVPVLPALLGAFWAVPMITRELEAGTHNLVWNQSVTRSRWLAVKLGLGAPAAMAAAGLLSLAVGWWAGLIDTAAELDTDSGFEPRIAPMISAARGIAPVGYAAFAFVLGIAVAILVRRTVVAMAVTLVLYFAVQLLTSFVVRPHLVPPVEEAVALTARSIAGVRMQNGSGGEVIESLTVHRPAGSWVLADETVDASGAAVVRLPDAVRGCLPPPPAGDAPPPDLEGMRGCLAQLADLGYRQRLTHHPAGHFWPLQWLELALYLVFSALLWWLSSHRLRHLS